MCLSWRRCIFPTTSPRFSDIQFIDLGRIKKLDQPWHHVLVLSSHRKTPVSECPEQVFSWELWDIFKNNCFFRTHLVASFHQIFRDKKTFEIAFFRFIGTGNEVDSPVTCEAKQKSHITLLPPVLISRKISRLPKFTIKTSYFFVILELWTKRLILKVP